MWHLFSGNNENNIIMQFWTDILKKMADFKYITEEDLYKYSEEEIVNKIRKCPNEKIANAFDIKYYTRLNDFFCSRKKIYRNGFSFRIFIKLSYNETEF